MFVLLLARAVIVVIMLLLLIVLCIALYPVFVGFGVTVFGLFDWGLVVCSIAL